MTAFHSRFTSLRISRPSGECASPMHHGERNFTSTSSKLSKTFSVSAPHPWLFAISRERIARPRDISRVCACPESRTLRRRSISVPPAVDAYGARRLAGGQRFAPSSALSVPLHQCAARLISARPERRRAASCNTTSPPLRSRPGASGTQKTRRQNGP